MLFEQLLKSLVEALDRSQRVSAMSPVSASQRQPSTVTRRIVHNNRITLRGVPEEAYRYMLGSSSAIEWIMER